MRRREGEGQDRGEGRGRWEGQRGFKGGRLHFSMSVATHIHPDWFPPFILYLQ